MSRSLMGPFNYVALLTSLLLLSDFPSALNALDCQENAGVEAFKLIDSSLVLSDQDLDPDSWSAQSRKRIYDHLSDTLEDLVAFNSNATNISFESSEAGETRGYIIDLTNVLTRMIVSVDQNNRDEFWSASEYIGSCTEHIEFYKGSQLSQINKLISLLIEDMLKKDNDN